MGATHVCQTCGTALLATASGSFCPGCAFGEERAETHELRMPPASAGGGIPRIFGDYELLEELGHGGMGLVFKARQRSLGRIVALKVLLSGRFSDRTARERLQREAMSAGRLQHPNIVAIHEFGEVDGHAYLTMDYVAGETLAEICARGPLPPQRAAEYLRDVARGVQAAHEAGVLHRDLTPANILIGEDGRPRVADFGLARLRDVTADLTLSGQMLGSPHYVSPEQAAARPEAIGPRSDVYSLGAVLYQLATGHAPFAGAKAAAVLRSVLSEDPVLPRRLNPELPRELETVCMKCLHKDPAQRYASAGALADDLENFLGERPLHARAPGYLYTARKFVQRHRVLVGSAAVAVAAAMATSTFWQRERAADRRVTVAHTQAETLVNLLLRDVRPSLEQFGRVAELDRLAEETARYFAELPPEARDANYAGHRAVALGMLAGVRWRSGDFGAAAEVAGEALAWRQRVLDESPAQFRHIAPLLRDAMSLQSAAGARRAPDAQRAAANVERLRALSREHPDDPFLAKELAIELLGLAGAMVDPDRDPAAGREELVEAREWMRRAMERVPDDPFFQVIHADAALQLGRLHKLCGDYPRAIAECEQAVAALKVASTARPGNLLLLERLAQAEHALAHQWAVHSLARAREAERAAREHFRLLSAADPRHAVWREMYACSHTVEAWYLLNNGQFEEARQMFAAAKATCVAIPASHSWANPMLLPWRFIDEGRAAAGVGDIARARAMAEPARAQFAKVIASRPAGSAARSRNEIGALLSEATLLAAAEEWPTVESLAREAADAADAYARERNLARTPLLDRAEARRLLGLARLRQGRAGDAEQPLREASALLSQALPVLHPFSSRELRLADTRDALGEVLLALGKSEEAQPVLEAALAFRETDVTRQPELAMAQAAFARTAGLLARSLDLREGEHQARRQMLLARAAEAMARPAAEGRLSVEQRQLFATLGADASSAAASNAR
jgi:tRNA A-37 threonylcarbamoyl transferase component Bud32/tetratricopeptide (TPR) repeat protein